MIVTKLASVDLFANVGGLGADVGSWQEALQKERADAWEEVEIEASGRIADVVRAKAFERHRLWNSIVQSVRPGIDAVVSERVAKLVPPEFVRAVSASVEWDWIGAALEVAYADLGPPRFYRDLVDVYTSGRFPCGWEGAFPTGRVLVY